MFPRKDAGLKGLFKARIRTFTAADDEDSSASNTWECYGLGSFTQPCWGSWWILSSRGTAGWEEARRLQFKSDLAWHKKVKRRTSTVQSFRQTHVRTEADRCWDKNRNMGCSLRAAGRSFWESLHWKSGRLVMVNQKKFQEFISMCQWMVKEGLPVVILSTIFKHFYLTGTFLWLV